MNLRFLICAYVVIFILNLNFICGQNEVLSCSYLDPGSNYRCDLTIINPNGFNNFTGINGTHLTGMSDADVKYIYGAAGSNTSNIPSIICEKFQNTLSIGIYASGIQKIDEDSFQKCKKLTSLDLKNNKIRQFHKNSFKENSELIQLLLWFNEITKLQEDPFTNLQKLTWLDFESNKIAVLPENIFKPLTGLERLYLERNLIEEIPVNALNALQNMTTFWIYSNKLKIVHADSFGMLPNLKTAYMFNNQIDAIDERFINNTGINRFDVRYNLCVSKDITDTSVSRESMRADLKLCFENYENLMPECAEGDLDERVCKLEGNHEEVIEDIQALKEDNEKMRTEIDNLTKEKQELEENVKIQNDIFATAISELEIKVIELKNCACGCH